MLIEVCKLVELGKGHLLAVRNRLEDSKHWQDLSQRLWRERGRLLKGRLIWRHSVKVLRMIVECLGLVWISREAWFRWGWCSVINRLGWLRRVISARIILLRRGGFRVRNRCCLTKIRLSDRVYSRKALLLM